MLAPASLAAAAALAASVLASAACSAADMLALVKEACRARGEALISAVAPSSVASETMLRASAAKSPARSPSEGRVTALSSALSRRTWVGLGLGLGLSLGLGCGFGFG